jgi:tRNA(Ile)-lysidine synthase TilS/MesJ
MPYYCKELPPELRNASNFQETTRDWRRQEARTLALELRRRSPEQGPYVICTAHHHDDQLETILMKLFRGVFIANLQGVTHNT